MAADLFANKLSAENLQFLLEKGLIKDPSDPFWEEVYTVSEFPMEKATYDLRLAKIHHCLETQLDEKEFWILYNHLAQCSDDFSGFAPILQDLAKMMGESVPPASAQLPAPPSPD